MTNPDPIPASVAGKGARLFGGPRFAGYLAHCNGDPIAALKLYQWNAEVSAAYWETLGHPEVALRNAVAEAAANWHAHRRRLGAWLDDPAGELDVQARTEIAKARHRVATKGHPASDGQTMAELGFGFWRFLLAKRYNTTLWPGLARAFPHAPNRRRQTVELLVVQLHDFRNRLAHHERIWNQPLAGRYKDILAVLGYIDPDLRQWVASSSRVPGMLGTCPQPRPYA